MKDMVRMTDIYGFNVNFTNFGQQKYKTLMGGFFTLLTITFLVILIVIFGRPFLYKLNPNVIVQSSDLNYYPLMQANFTNFPVAFRFENEKRAKADIGSYLFPWIELVRMKKNSEGYMSVVGIKNLNYTTCNSDLIEDPAILAQVDGWSCVDWKGTDNELGGNWDSMSTYAYYFKITVFFCAYDGKSYTNCTDYKTLNNLLNDKTKIYLSINLPSVSTTPSDYDRPLKTTTSNVFFTLNPLLMRTERYSYRNVTVHQDIGWLTESFRSFIGFTLDKRDIDLQIRTVEDYNDPKKIKTIATAVFIYTNKVEQIEVSFSKIQTVAANVGGVMKLFMEVFRMFCFFYGTQTVYYDIINSLSQTAFQEIGASKTPKISMMMSFKNLESESNEQMKGNNVSSTLKPFFQSPPQLQNYVKESKKKPVTPKVSVIERIKKSKRIFLSSYEYIKNKILCKYKDINMLYYSQHENRIKNKLDILYYLQFSNSYDILSSLILSKGQNLCLKNMSKMGSFSDDHITFGEMTRDEQITLDNFLRCEETTTELMDKKILETYGKIMDLV